MVEHGRVELLSHPVCLTYLHMKWSSYGFFFHILNMGMYLVFVACLTGIAGYLDPRTTASAGVVTWIVAANGKNASVVHEASVPHLVFAFSSLQS